MREVKNFEILSVMADRNLDIRLAPIENISEMKLVNKGKDTKITIGVGGPVLNEIWRGKLSGGMLLFDMEQYQQIKKELEDQLSGTLK